MITKTKQQWTPGATVKVGFVADLLVVAAIMTPGDSMPDAYVLSRNSQFYSFVPHNGLSKIDILQAREMIAESRTQSLRIADAAIAKAAEQARHIAALNEFIFA